jgi:anti-sigma-K factor RskA
MSGNESVDLALNHDVLAFEYVTGVMRGNERATFERLLKTNEGLADQVRFWEEQLIQLSDEQEQRAPAADTWAGIQARLHTAQAPTPVVERKVFSWPRWSLWAMPTLAIFLLAGLLFLVVPAKNSVGPNADYVAVLTDTKGAARLTVLTATKGTALWLKWDDLKISPSKNVQLWAVSKRDGQIRPLGVFAQTNVAQVELSTANWRLIKDAESLLLTEEDVGGSAIDEPSDVILAKGVCVLLAKIENSI